MVTLKSNQYTNRSPLTRTILLLKLTTVDRKTQALINNLSMVRFPTLQLVSNNNPRWIWTPSMNVTNNNSNRPYLPSFKGNPPLTWSALIPNPSKLSALMMNSSLACQIWSVPLTRTQTQITRPDKQRTNPRLTTSLRWARSTTTTTKRTRRYVSYSLIDWVLIY